MKKHFLLAILLFASFHGIFYGQRFQATTGTNLPEEQWAIVNDPSINAYVSIGNTTVGGISRLWITSYNATGVLQTSATATNDRPMIARDISLAPPNNGIPSYYVTGWTLDAVNGTVHRMFVGRIGLDGAFLWYKESPTPSFSVLMEGVAVVTAPNNDVVVAGNILAGGLIGGSFQIFLARFDLAGNPLWGITYNASGANKGNWMVREIDLGVASPGCPVPLGSPGYFVVTGEVKDMENTFSGLIGSHTFVSLYNGSGSECWRNIYPADVVGVSEDAGYDVVYEPATNSYCIAGVAQTGPVREAASSTPYIFRLAPSGALLAGAVYLFNGAAVGYYPRCISLASNAPLGGVVFAGPSYRNVIGNNNNGNNRVWFGQMPPVLAPLPPLISGFYNGPGTASSVIQPFWLNNAVPEDIIATSNASLPGYLISANARPGQFGNGDAHLIRTDLGGNTPNACRLILSPNNPVPATRVERHGSSPLPESMFDNMATSSAVFIIKQQFCRDTCIVGANFDYTQVFGGPVNFTAMGSGNGSLLFQWDFGDGATTGISAANGAPSHVYLAPGTYTACLTVYNINPSGDTCTAKYCKTITIVGIGIGVGDKQLGLLPKLPTLVIYPNPITEQINLQLQCQANATAAVQISDVQGVVINRMKARLLKGNNILTIPTKEWLPGIYFVKIVTDKATLSQHFVKR